jgi:DNA-binding transcriptional LysR family regulator
VVARVGSIRKASEELSITSTTLNREILAIEAELGVPIFDRLPTRVCLSVAGELFSQHSRKQLTDMERVHSQIADLSDERRGHVSVICGQALMNCSSPR